MGEWIAEIHVAPEVEAKLRSKHRLTGDQVRQAVAFGNADAFVWDEHSRYGRRLIATATTTVAT